MLNNAPFPFRTIGIAVFVASVMALVFFWIRHYVVPLLHDRNTIRTVNRWLPRLEIAAWSAFGLMLLVAALRTDLVRTVVLVFLVGLAGWRIWRDLFTGLYFRLAARFLPGDPIIIGDVTGTVVRSGTRALEIMTSAGGTAWIPYHKVASEVVGQQATSTDLKRRNFQFELRDMDHLEALKNIERCLLRDPWVASARPITIAEVEEGVYSIDLHLIDADAFPKVKSSLVKAMGASSK